VFDISLEYKDLQRHEEYHQENIEKGRTSEKPERPILSGFLNEVRTYSEKKFCMHSEKSLSKKVNPFTGTL
jgi:hypothetical protein